MLLESHALRNNIALLSLLASRDLFLDQFIVLNALYLCVNQISSAANSVHKLSLEQVVKRVQIEALVQQLEVDIFGQTHQTDSLVLNLRYQRFVRAVLRCDKFCDEVLAVGFCDRLRL